MIPDRESARETMRAARDDLASVMAASEAEIGSLARTFQKLARGSSRILGLASTIVERIEDDSVTSVLSTLRALASAEMALIESRLQATHGILETTGVERNVLRQLSKVTRSQSGIALKTRILAMMTNVEVGRLGSSGTSFEYLAGELNKFTRTLSQDTDELERHTGNRRNAIEAANRILASELPRLVAALARIKISLGDDLAALESGLARLSSIPSRFKTCAQQIAAQIAGAVAAIQSYDITRQQIDHVLAAIETIAQQIHPTGGRRKGNSQEHSQVAMGIRIQMCQLRQIRETVFAWISQVRECLHTLLQMSASDMASISPIVRAREAEISARLDHIELMGSQCKAHAQSICSTVGEHSSLVELIDQQVRTAGITRQTLHLLSLNAIIEGDRLGTQANAVLEIGNGISDLTQEWGRITDQSDLAKHAISELVEKVTQLTATFSEMEDEKLQQAQVHARTGLQKLRAAAECAARQSQDIERGLESMKLVTSGITKSVDLLETGYRQFDRVLSVLETLQLQFEDDPHEAWNDQETEEIERRFSASLHNGDRAQRAAGRPRRHHVSARPANPGRKWSRTILTASSTRNRAKTTCEVLYEASLVRR